MSNNIYVTKPSLPDFNEYVDEIKGIWETNLLTNFGPKYNKFVEQLRDKFGYENINLHCNGHMTLQNILCCIESGEIITSPFTFISTALAIKNSGHKPVFCDIEPETYNIDVSKIEELINENTRAIVPIHVFGSPCDVEELEKIGEKYNLKVIYDAAHAFGCKCNGVNIGEFGDASMFSFHATKVYNTIEGGMAVFKHPEMMEMVHRLSNFGLDGEGVSIGQGVNSKMNEFQAAMGIVNLKHFNECVQARKKCVELYDSLLGDDSRIKVLKRNEVNEYNYSYYPIVLKNTKITVDELLEELSSENVYARRYFYPAINKMPAFHTQEKTPIAEGISKNILCLPLYVGLDESDIRRIVTIIKRGLDNER